MQQEQLPQLVHSVTIVWQTSVSVLYARQVRDFASLHSYFKYGRFLKMCIGYMCPTKNVLPLVCGTGYYSIPG